jgi:ribA/ribD-fused uncharacterized protein
VVTAAHLVFVVEPLPAGARPRGPLDFYGRRLEFPEGSNFHRAGQVMPHPFRAGDLVELGDNETWFNACKATNEPDFDWVCASTSPAQAKRRGSRGGERQADGTVRCIDFRGDWDAVSFTVMVVGLRVKFAADPMRAKLQATGRRLLREASPTDRRWGIGADAKGANLLGQALMLVREEQRLGQITRR